MSSDSGLLKSRPAKWRPWLWFGLTAVMVLFLLTSLATAEEATPVPTSPRAMATIDRLAAPPTVASPTQADEGAQLFWLNCQPCHGDRGQGLTDEWRAQFPEEDQDCWQSGCHGTHGKEPGPDGFVLPTAVPALIGPANELSRFGTLGQVYQYTRANMPYEAPGSLADQEYLAITAYIARAHGLWDGSPLTVDNMDSFSFDSGLEANETPSVPRDGPVDKMGLETTGQRMNLRTISFGGIVVGLVICWGAWKWQKSRKETEG